MRIMVPMNNSFKFSAEVWEYNGENSWHLITIPVEIGKTIKTMDEFTRGFGSVRVIASVGSSKWQTSIFPIRNQSHTCFHLKKR